MANGVLSKLETLSFGDSGHGWFNAVQVPAGLKLLEYLDGNQSWKSEKFSNDAGEGVGTFCYWDIPDTPENREILKDYILKNGFSWRKDWWEFDNKAGIRPEYLDFVDEFIEDFFTDNGGKHY